MRDLESYVQRREDQGIDLELGHLLAHDAQFLLQSVHALDAEAGAVAVMLESSCGSSNTQQREGGAEEEQRPEAWAAALESMLEGLEGMGGEAHIQGLGEKFLTCIE